VRDNAHMTKLAAWPAAAVAVLVASLLVAACGGGPARNSVPTVGHGKTTSTKSVSSFDASGLEYSVCMRKHGVPDFPDPTINGAHYSLNIEGTAGAPAPVFQAAQEACAKYSPSNPPPGSVPASYLKQMLVAAQCLRSHGFPDFPDPTTHPPGSPPAGFAEYGVNGVYFVIPDSIGGPGAGGAVQVMNSPVFQRAAAACGFPGP
jgi:hypothetical protein